jgi:hypothetical protein
LIPNFRAATPSVLRGGAVPRLNQRLAIGYQKDFAFEIERPASSQKTAIAQYRQWARTLDQSIETDLHDAGIGERGTLFKFSHSH